MRIVNWLPYACLMLTGCIPSRAADVSVVLEHGNCQQIERGARRVEFAEVARLRGAELLAMNTPTDAKVADLVLVAVSLGSRPTLGYRLHAVGDPRVEDRVLTISVGEEAPAKDAIVAQMVTEPCIVFGVSSDDLRSIHIEDAAGNTIGDVEVPKPATP